MKGKLPTKRTIRSAIYGNMEFDEEQMRFIESFYLQRLRHVSQMGLLHLVYPDARHSRFEHSLGVLHSLKTLLGQDPAIRKQLSDEQRKTLFFAAILHDCGHGPFSHTTESLLELSGLDVQLRKTVKGESASVKPHERRARDLIQNSDFHLGNLGISSYGLKEMLEELGVNPTEVVSIILGNKPSLLVNLLSGDFDVDKMDYFRRDAFFTGTTGGGVDMEAMQRWVTIFDESGYPTAAYDSRLVGHLVHLLYSREHVYSITAYHPAARIAAALILVAGDLSLRALPGDAAALIFSNIEILDDRELLSVLEIAAMDVSNAEADLLRRVLQRLYLRRLPKRLATLSRFEFLRDFAACIPTLEQESGKLPQMVYTRLSDIKGGKYLKLLGHASTDDIAILEMTPKLGPTSADFEKCEKEGETLEGIFIRHKGSPTTSLQQWLEENAGDGAGDAHARALRAYKLSIWKALVAVPASLRAAITAAGKTEEFIADFAATLADDTLCRPLKNTRGPWSNALSGVGQNLKKWRAEAMRKQADNSKTR
jgi:HD superfamily phosphohydrolase